MMLSASTPNFTDIVDKGLAFTHYLLSGIDSIRNMAGAHPNTKHIDSQNCKDLGLLPPHVQRPVYGW